MEEFDSHTEHAQEQSHEAAHESREKWITGVALTAAILAAFAAITSMVSGHHEHEAMMLQIQASDRWNQYQAKKIKTLLRENEIETIKASGEETEATKEKVKGLEKKVDDAKGELKEFEGTCKLIEENSRFHDHLHMMFGGGVTLFQVAIAVAAVAALTRRRAFWFVGISLGVVALGFLAAGVLVGGGVVGHRPPAPPEEQNTVEKAPAHHSSS